MFLFILSILSITALIIVLFFVLRLVFSELATRNILVTNIKNGRIKFITKTKGGAIIKYLANLKGLNKHIDEKTGSIKDSEEEEYCEGNSASFLWHMFGVRWIGLCSVYTYDFKKKLIDDSSDENATVLAESIFFRSSYIINCENIEAVGTISFDFKIRLTIEIVDSQKTISLGENWPAFFINPAKDSLRSIIGSIDPMDVISKKNTGIKTRVCKAIIKHPAPEDVAGIKITGVDILEIEPDNEFKTAMTDREKNTLIGDANIEAAKKKQEVVTIDAVTAKIKAQGEAEAIWVVGETEADVLRNKLTSLNGDGKTLVGVSTAEAIGKNAELKYISFAGSTGSVIVPEL